jgi:peptidoglycan/LPS O-acetylase OafA/YrhL
MMVVFSHATIASVPALAAVALLLPVHLSGLQRAITYTPLHLLWAGQEWVIVFFVLSGFVLSLAASDGQRFDGAAYYPHRFVRLYVPVWGALVVATVAHLAVSHSPIDGATPWLNGHDTALGLGRAGHDATLIFGAGDGSFTTVLWSLQWEVLFSILLPLYLLIAARVNLIVVAAMSLIAILLGGIHNDYAHYLPTFMLGTVVAYGRTGIVRAVSERRAWILLGASLCCLSANWWMPSGFGQNVGIALVAMGATGVVICGIVADQFRRLLNTRFFQLVGARSFSLYLVHEPLIVAVAFALGGRAGLPLLLLAALPLIVAVTEMFYRLVELPSHRLARQASGFLRQFSSGFDARSAEVPQEIGTVPVADTSID